MSKDGSFTEKDFDRWVKTAQEQPMTPNYTMMPDAIVDESLRLGVIPKFVMVSPRSYDKIKKYAEAEAENE